MRIPEQSNGAEISRDQNRSKADEFKFGNSADSFFSPDQHNSREVKEKVEHFINLLNEAAEGIKESEFATLAPYFPLIKPSLSELRSVISDYFTNKQLGMRESLCTEGGYYLMTQRDMRPDGSGRHPYPMLEVWTNFQTCFQSSIRSLPIHQMKLAEMLIDDMRYFADLTCLFAQFVKMNDEEKALFLDCVTWRRDDISGIRRIGNVSGELLQNFRHRGGYSLYIATELSKASMEIGELKEDRTQWLKTLGDFLWREIEAMSRTGFVPPVQSAVSNTHEFFKVPEGHIMRRAFFDERMIDPDADASINDRHLVVYFTYYPETEAPNFQLFAVDEELLAKLPPEDRDMVGRMNPKSEMAHVNIHRDGFTCRVIDGDIVSPDGNYFNTFETLYAAFGKSGLYQKLRVNTLLELHSLMSECAALYPSLEELEHLSTPEEAMEYVKLVSKDKERERAMRTVQGGAADALTEYKALKLPEKEHIPVMLRSFVHDAAEKLGITLSETEFLAHPDYASPSHVLEVIRTPMEERERPRKRKPIGGTTPLRDVRRTLKFLGCDIQTKRGAGSHAIAVRYDENGQLLWTTIASEHGRHVRRDQLLPCLRQLNISKEAFEFAQAE